MMKKSNWHGGKGSTPRTDTSSKQYQDNWDTIFGKHKSDVNKYDQQLRNNSIESADKKHYGEKNEDKDV